MSIFPVMCVRSGQCTAYPDVCLTPSPAGPPIPIPYPNMGNPADGGGTERVKTMNSSTLRKGDQINRSSGDNAGNAPGGQVNGQFMGSVDIKTGDPKVKIDGHDVAFHTVMCAHNGNNANAPTGGHLQATQTKVKVKGAPRSPGTGLDTLDAGGLVDVAEVLERGKSPLNDGADATRCSPTMQRQLNDFRQGGGTVDYNNQAGDPTGSWFRAGPPPRIAVDPGDSGNPLEIGKTFAHELGHANWEQFAGNAWSPRAAGRFQGRMPKREYVDRSVRRGLDHEGAATLNNVQINNEVKQNCPGKEVGVAAGSPQNARRYEQIANDPNLTDDQRRTQIGDSFAANERPSTNPRLTYGQDLAQQAWGVVRDPNNRGLFF